MSFNHNPNIVRNGLVLCLDAKDLKSYSGSGTTWVDRSGNGYNVTLVNGVSYSNGAMVFDGVNDYVDCGSVYNFGSSTSKATIIVWARGSGYMISNRRTSSNHGWIFVNNTDRIFNLYVDAYGNLPYGESFTQNISSTPFTSLSSDYKMFSVTIDRSTNKYMLGINSYFSEFTRSFNVEGYQNFNVIDIGRINNFTYNTSYFNGNINTVQIYNRALSQAEILQNFNAQKGRYGI